ncbi:protein TonB [Epsilonproteobacteria bacterium SCGC AD-311-C15]|jgi:periplasmic protein TonB|nr:protein TonB [Epsilonproteobacteria bacterium SCGC AD-311-C15]
MAENKSLFYISGFISVSLFVLLLSLFFYMLFSSNKIKEFALTKDNYISVSMDTAQFEVKSAKKRVTTPVEKEIKKDQPVIDPVVTEIAQPTKTPTVDVSNLFNNVWTQKIKKQKTKEKVTDNKRIQEIQKKIEMVKSSEGSDIAKKDSTKDDKQSNEQESHKSSGNEVNEYLAKIQALVYTHFNPPENSQGNSVKAVINLSSIGKVLDFRILNYSANSSLNAECDKIKDRLMSVVFPVNPQNKSGNYIIILTSKE